MNKGFLIALIIVIIAAMGISFLYAKSQAEKGANSPVNEKQEVVVDQKNTETVRKLAVEAKKESFSPDALSVNVGDKVEITYKNSGEALCNFVIDDFEVNSGMVKVGESTKFVFTAEKAGIFEYYCGFPNHKTPGMSGKLEVK